MRGIKELSFGVMAAAALLGTTSAAAQTLRGSRASVELMYERAQERSLDFMATPNEVYRALEAGTLQTLSFTDDLALDKAAFPFVLPNTRRFTDSLATEFHSACGERLVVTSGVRPLDKQPRNASPQSVHPTGMAVDFRKPRDKCLAWLRESLVKLEAEGVVEATEERRPAHFHVAVLNQQPRQRVADSKSIGATPAAAKVASAAGEVSLEKPSDARKGSVARKSGGETRTSTYVVRAGDNLSTIAMRHGATTEELQKLNGLRTSRIKVGQRIKLPER
jgi:LysM repeat protein